MSASISIDTTEFNAALREYVKVSKRTLAAIINKKAFWICIKAHEGTVRADNQRIMEATALSFNKAKINKKTGRVTMSYRIDKMRAAVALLQGRNIARGLPPFTQAEAKKRALRVFVSRLNAIGTLAAGWIGAVRKLIKAAQEPPPKMAYRKHKGQGAASPAREGWSPKAEFSYNLAERKKEGFQIDPRVVETLQNAFNHEAASMMDYVATWMQKDADRFNAK